MGGSFLWRIGGIRLIWRDWDIYGCRSPSRMGGWRLVKKRQGGLMLDNWHWSIMTLKFGRGVPGEILLSGFMIRRGGCCWNIRCRWAIRGNGGRRATMWRRRWGRNMRSLG